MTGETVGRILCQGVGNGGGGWKPRHSFCSWKTEFGNGGITIEWKLWRKIKNCRGDKDMVI